ncbi:hypothetical protein AK812_SmicGene29073 [Symbiodinium microadriaticum]|uniref:Uncharacterized protein n=1 Tax=Symbiodinium microadriaticum TaxID=2951 RepID=A0A1Q9D2R9_SYMMI|nr:hypothetical protein AK812_SmicGene29073 [Symbiodinium microadriaticum]
MMTRVGTVDEGKRRELQRMRRPKLMSLIASFVFLGDEDFLCRFDAMCSTAKDSMEDDDEANDEDDFMGDLVDELVLDDLNADDKQDFRMVSDAVQKRRIRRVQQTWQSIKLKKNVAAKAKAKAKAKGKGKGSEAADQNVDMMEGRVPRPHRPEQEPDTRVEAEEPEAVLWREQEDYLEFRRYWIEDNLDVFLILYIIVPMHNAWSHLRHRKAIGGLDMERVKVQAAAPQVQAAAPWHPSKV